MSIRHFALASISFALLASCSEPPADVAGTYAMNFTNGANGCMFSDWDGGMTTGIPVVVTQNSTAVTATVQGLAATQLDILFGAHVFSGSISGRRLDLTLQGSRMAMSGGCSYSLNATLDATLTGDVLQGNIEYVPVTNHDASCGYLETCTTEQATNGARPPR